MRQRVLRLRADLSVLRLLLLDLVLDIFCGVEDFDQFLLRALVPVFFFLIASPDSLQSYC